MRHFLVMLALLCCSSCALWARETATHQTFPRSPSLEELEHVFWEGHNQLRIDAQHEIGERIGFYRLKSTTGEWTHWRRGSTTIVTYERSWIEEMCESQVDAVVIAHTHPRGGPPSMQDVCMTIADARMLHACRIPLRTLVVTQHETWSVIVQDGESVACEGAERNTLHRAEQELVAVCLNESEDALLRYYAENGVSVSRVFKNKVEEQLRVCP